MSVLPCGIDTQLTDDIIEKARQTILEAKRKSPDYKFCVSSATSSSDILQLCQQSYDELNWNYLVDVVNEAKNGSNSCPPELDVLLAMATCMATSASAAPALYDICNTFQPKYVLNGDLYIALAVCKLAWFRIEDCRALLNLASLCPCYHEKLVAMVQDKMDWTLRSYNSEILSLCAKLREPEFLKKAKEEIFEVKNAGSAIDAEVDEFLNAAPLDRYRLLLHWWLTPHLRVLAQFQPNPDLSLINPNSELLKLPEKAFDSILEFLDLDSIRHVMQTNAVANRRVRNSCAWLYHSSSLIGIKLCHCAYAEFNFPVWAELLRLSKHLATASIWDISGFNVIESSFIARNKFYLDASPALTPSYEVALSRFFDVVSSYARHDKTGYGVQYLVSRSNLHVTLARMAYGFSHNLVTKLLDALFALLDSPAVGTLTWINQLKDMGFERTLLQMMGHFPPETDASACLQAWLAYRHLIDPETTVRHFQEESDLRILHFEKDDVEVPVKNHFSGVWHLLWFPSNLWIHEGVKPHYATFRVDSDDVRLHKGATPSTSRASLRSDSGLVCWAPSGNIDRDSTFTANFVGSRCDLSVHAPSDLLNFTFNGSWSSLGVVGSFLSERENNSTDLLEEDIEPNRGSRGTFLLWKSTALDTESNWNREVEEMNALSAFRKSGLAHQVHSKFMSRIPVGLHVENPFEGDAAILETRRNIRILATEVSSMVIAEKMSVFDEDQRDELIREGGSPQLPCGLYEDDEIFQARSIACEVWVNNLGKDYELVFREHLGPSLFADMAVLLQALIDLYSKIRDAYGDCMSSNVQKRSLAIQQTTDLHIILGSSHDRNSLQRLIDAAKRALPQVDKLKEKHIAEVEDHEVRSVGMAVIPVLLGYISDTDPKVSGDPLQIGLAGERLVRAAIGDDVYSLPQSASSEAVSHSLASSSNLSASHDGIGIIERMKREINRIESMTEAKRVYLEWATRIGSASPALEIATRPVTLEMLLLWMVGAIMGTTEQDDFFDGEFEDHLYAGSQNDEEDDLEVRQQVETDLDSAISQATENSHRRHGFGFHHISAPLVLGFASVLAITAFAAFAIGRAFPKSKD